MHIHLLHHLKPNPKAKILIKNSPDKGNTKYKSPKARISLVCCAKKACVAVDSNQKVSGRIRT